MHTLRATHARVIFLIAAQQFLCPPKSNTIITPINNQTIQTGKKIT